MNPPNKRLYRAFSVDQVKILSKMIRNPWVRGCVRIQVGMVADITMFDPNTATDHSTYTNGTLPSTGIHYVIVNRIIVMKNSEPIKRFEAGQPIRLKV